MNDPNLQRFIEKLIEQWPRLSRFVSIKPWQKHGRKRLYVSRTSKKGNDIKFFIDFTQELPVLGLYSAKYWQYFQLPESQPFQQEIQEIWSSIKKDPATSQSLTSPSDENVDFLKNSPQRTDNGGQRLIMDMFPINETIIPTLTGYILKIPKEQQNKIGHKLAYQAKAQFNTKWVWSNNHLVTDTPVTPEELQALVKKLWHEAPNLYQDLQGIYLDSNWTTTPQTQADYVARGMMESVKTQIKRRLHARRVNLGPADLLRVFDVRGWVVNEHPALAVTIRSKIVTRIDLKAYMAKM